MAKDYIKYILVVLGVTAAVLAIVFGSYEPFAKSQLFIKALRGQSNVKTFEEYRQNFDTAFDSPSPIGNEELTKFLSDNIISLVSSQNQSEDVSRALVSYIEPHISQNDVRQLLAYGDMCTILLQRFHRADDFNKAEGAYLRAFAIGPKLPPVIYSLLDLYSIAGNADKFRQIAATALSYWPDDAKLKAIFDSIKPVSVTPVIKK